MGNVAFLFAGQGSQHPGMGASLAQASRAAADVFEVADVVRRGTSEQCFSGTKEELSQTESTQPCVFATDLAAARALGEQGILPAAVAGHSLGEVAALTFAGALSDVEGMSFVCLRAQLMAGCAQRHPGAMRAVLKLDPHEVSRLAEQAGEAWAVNFNSPAQTVVAGSREACEKLDSLVKAAGGRSVSLAVSGAFHSPYMSAATNGLLAHLVRRPLREPALQTWSNLTGEPYAGTAGERGRALAEQVSHPVQWVRTLEGMRAAGIDAFVEVGPGHALSGLVRHTLEGVTTLSVETADELAACVSALRGGE